MTRRAQQIAFVIIGVTILVFVAQVRLHFFLGDDAFISFRYAQHMAAGEGVVWNPGERVEGYTNFLWVLLMAAGIKLGVRPESFSTILGIASGAAVLLVVSILAARLSERRTLLVLAPAFFLALSRTFTAWTTGGLETMWFTLLITAALLAVIEERRRVATLPIGSAVLLGLAALTRPEGILFTGIVAVWLALEAVNDRHRLRPFLIWAAVPTSMIGTHLLWRYAYYGAWLPNTFAAKVPAAWWDQGLVYAADFTRAYGLPLFLPWVVWAMWRRGVDRDRLLVVTCVVVYAAYVVAVGGDRFEFRFWVPVLPILYWLTTDALERLRFQRHATALVLVTLLGTTLHGTLQADGKQLPRGHGIAPVSAIKAYATRRIEEGRRLRELIEAGVLRPDLVLAVTGAGAVPYYTDWPTVDVHGLNDRYIAHLPVVTRGVIGHERYAPSEYLERRRVVIFDALNRLVHEKATPMQPFPNETRPLYVADIGDAYLVFSSYVPDTEVRQALSQLPPDQFESPCAFAGFPPSLSADAFLCQQPEDTNRGEPVAGG